MNFSTSGSRFIGDFAHVVLINVLDKPAFGTATVPDIAFCFFQLMFAATSTTGIQILISIFIFLCH